MSDDEKREAIDHWIETAPFSANPVHWLVADELRRLRAIEAKARRISDDEWSSSTEAGVAKYILAAGKPTGDK